VADELERLLGLPLDEFTAARTEAVKRLRREGRADEAAELQAVKKPPAAVWGLNQAARREPGDVRALVRAAERLRQEPAGADADFRTHLGDVVREAERALAEAKHTVSQDTTRRITTTARAAAASAPDELTRGVLREELEPSGFEAMAGTAPPAKPRKGAAKKDDAAARRKRVEEARRALAEARDEARRLRQEADAAERAAAKAAAAAEQAEDAVREAEERLEAARGS
jgi:colicin import membrane protein